MSIFPFHSSLPTTALAVAIAGLWGVLGQAQESHETGGSIEVRELRAALELAQGQLAEEQARSANIEAQRRALVEGLAEAVRVSEEQLASSRETQLKLQAFGVDLFTREENSLEQRLLKAVRDLDIAQQEIERKTAAVHRLSESFLKYLQATTDAPESKREEAEASIAAAGGALASGSENREAAGDLSRSRIVSIDSDIGLIVFDAGRRSGLRVGTPLTVLRGERPIYSAIVVDVRDSISGAVLQDRMADIGDVAVGDGIRLLPEQRTL